MKSFQQRQSRYFSGPGRKADRKDQSHGVYNQNHTYLDNVNVTIIIKQNNTYRNRTVSDPVRSILPELQSSFIYRTHPSILQYHHRNIPG